MQLRIFIEIIMKNRYTHEIITASRTKGELQGWSLVITAFYMTAIHTRGCKRINL